MQTPVAPNYFRPLARRGSKPESYLLPPIASDIGT